MEKKRAERVGFRLLLAAALALTGALSSRAFDLVPKASGKALGITRGKPFRSGLVFVNGKCLEPPYVVERWGTGIRINGKPVTGQIVDWNEFLKTQAGVKTVKADVTATPADSEPVEAAPEPVPPPVSETVPDAAAAASSLDDLFDDEPAKRPAPRRPSTPAVVKASRPVPPPRARASVSLALEGEFVPNDVTKAHLARINAERTKIDRTLRSGGFICFGDGYSRVVGDARTLASLLDALPEIQQEAEDLADFRSRARSANLVYLNEILLEDLYRNRTDYRKLKELRRRFRRGQTLEGVLNTLDTDLF